MAAVGVGLFAGLKWRLVRNRQRGTSTASRAWMIVGLVVLLALLVLAAIGLSLLREVPAAGYLVVTGLYTLQLVAWVLTPLVAFGVDETVDPQRFALLPLSRARLQRGLLVSSLVGYLPVANLIVLVGAAIGLSFLGWMFPIALLCAGLQLITCVVFSRAAATAMSALMTSRRGRDLGMLVGFGVVVLYMVANLLLSGTEDGSGLGAGATKVAEVLAWGPTGSLATLPAYLAAGMWWRAVLAVVIALGFLAVGWWWWASALRTSLTTTPSDTSGSAPSRGLRGASAIGGTIGGTARLVGGRDLTLMWRDPMRRMPWLLALLMAIAWPLLVFRGGGAVFGCAFGALLFGSQAANQFGIEGSGIWLHLVAFADRQRARGEVWGHCLVVVLPSAVLITVSVLVVAAVQGDWDQLPAALGLNVACLTGAVAAGAVLSAYIPYGIPQSRKSMFASSVPGQKGRSAQATIGTLLGGLLLALPAGGCVVLALLVDPLWGWVGLLIGVLGSPLLLSIAVSRTADKLLASGPEIFETVRAGDRV